ncbi:5'-nucleotidase C-terminal domain-containing protein [Belliella sp. DSM 111904]|uniref:5'-nucleotidase C-terminal domain-containing protein n=1 Tax=Belliella filtrata TaxID=2923435 RepID=A0ABS9UYA7_9BACT|nr:5'-nucleotidase [Belliella filtrata]MCH7409099.1 5'-nucleotidase C-terminal domain-containing protein [Belliella filtrata]
MKNLSKHYHPFLIFAVIFWTCCAPQLSLQSSGNFVPVSEEIQESEELVQMITPYKVKLEQEMNEVIGVSSQALTRSKGESLLGNFVADVQRDYTEKALNLPIDISIINNGGMRNDLPKGNITLGNIYELSPFDNYLTILELRAADVSTLATFMAKYKNMSVSGMQISGREDQLDEFLINGKSLEENRTYLLAINDYLANGGDNMGFLSALPAKEKTDILLRDMLIEVIREMSSNGEQLNAEIEGRQKYN